MTTELSPTLSHVSAPTLSYFTDKFFGHVIDGVVEESIEGGTMPVIDPSTGIQIATAASGTAADVDRVVASSRRAFDEGVWRNLSPLEKEARLHSFSRIIEQNRTIFGDLDAVDAGLLRTYTAFIEDFGINATAYFAGWPTKLHGSIPPVPAGMNVQHRRVPRGVVAAIVPWNGPSAVVAMAALSLPEPGSVRPKQVIDPAATLGHHSAFWASVPPFLIAELNMPTLIEKIERKAGAA